MAANLIADLRDGDYVNWTATAAVTSGDMVRRAGLVGVALITGVTGDTIPVAVSGVWELTKPTGVAFTQGAPVFRNNSSGLITTTVTGGTYVGRAWLAATAGASQNKVKVALKGFSISVGNT